ncbi:hypothetical protein [Paludisphaera mucosa]|uniref:Uncharacterized protein n=1 Tax=Paludisphaera mucosa TaxID=3030827 RepID=A0ABT6F4X0_9BACT|nr:hypothetical protein [Paludisphaera mucosa]MDG3002488.1 hypothetical protein [Paludisphaera mucosa]
MNLSSIVPEAGGDHEKASRWILESPSVCAHDHVFSRKLLDRFANARGSIFAVMSGDVWPNDLLVRSDTVRFSHPAEWPEDERPVVRLSIVMREYLQSSADAVVVCENGAANARTFIDRQTEDPPPVSCFGDEVFHIVTPDVTDLDAIENAIGSRHHWQTGVCSRCQEPPKSDIDDAWFLDEIVDHTAHIFVPAFDGGGYLIWSPEVRDSGRRLSRARPGGGSRG